MPQPLPHLQFAVLGALAKGRRTGREIRETLRELDVRREGPAFYRLMSRLEESGLVRGWYQQETVDGQIIRERAYEPTAEGLTEWEQTRAFHAAVIGMGLGEAHA